MLVSLISVRNKTLLSYGDASAEHLAVQYIDLHSKGGLKQFFFDYGLVAIPFPELREKIEYKMLQEFFINFYNLPREFKFANYMCQVLKNYVISLVEVRPITWVILVVFIVFNYLRIIIVDPHYQADVCKHYPAKNMGYGTHRMLAGGSSDGGESSGRGPNYKYHVCNEYTLRYIFFCSMLIVFYLVGVFVASELYIQRLIDKVLDVEVFIEKEEERVALEETPMYDVDDLVDHPDELASPGKDGSSSPIPLRGIIRSGSASETKTESGKHGGKIRPPSLEHPNRADLNRKRTITLEGNHHNSQGLFRNGSVQSLESVDIEGGGAGHSTRFRSNSISSQHNHRGSIALTAFGDDTSVFQGIFTAKTRRHLYLNCLQRMIQSEEEHHKVQARRMSMNSDDGHGNRGSAHLVPQRSGRSHGHNFHSEAYGHSRPKAHPNSGNNRDSLRSQNSNNHGRSHHTDEHATSFRDVNPMATRNRGQSRATALATASGEELDGTAWASPPLSPTHDISTLPPLRARSYFWEKEPRRHYVIPKVPNVADLEVAPTYNHHTTRDHHHQDRGHSGGGHHASHGGRPRGFSLQYFEVEKEDESAAKKNVDHGFFAKCFGYVARFARAAWKTTHDTMMGHHIGLAHDQVKQDADIMRRLQEFQSIFAFGNAELYYISVELALLIQCFYIALWATNFVVIARDSYYPVLWQVALVVPLPVNFFMIKQIIFTSCILKSIVHMDQRTANKIVEQAVDERNVTQRLRRIVREAMKGWDLPKKEWMPALKERFDEYADDYDNTIDKDNFKALLHDIKIFITDESLKNLFTVIDVDKDKRISWHILSSIVFPDHRKKRIKLRKRTTTKGHVAYDYSISEEAKKEITTAERRGSVMETISRVSESTVTAIRTNSFNRLSLVGVMNNKARTGSNDNNNGDKSDKSVSNSATATPDRPQKRKSLSDTNLLAGLLQARRKDKEAKKNQKEAKEMDEKKNQQVAGEDQQGAGEDVVKEELVSVSMLQASKKAPISSPPKLEPPSKLSVLFNTDVAPETVRDAAGRGRASAAVDDEEGEEDDVESNASTRSSSSSGDDDDGEDPDDDEADADEHYLSVAHDTYEDIEVRLPTPPPETAEEIDNNIAIITLQSRSNVLRVSQRNLFDV